MMGKRIMVVDDETITLKTCEFILQKNDYEVVSMNSGLKCLDYLRNPENPKIDLVLLDIEMPMLNGYNTLSSIRKSEALKELPVIFLTATATPDTVKEAIRLGVNSYLKKPFVPQDLLDRVENVLDEAENGKFGKLLRKFEAESGEGNTNTDSAENADNTDKNG